MIEPSVPRFRARATLLGDLLVHLAELDKSQRTAFFGRLKQPNLAVLDQVEHLFRGHDFRTITGCFKYDITKEELHV
jgi:hypothetical protein